MEKVKVGIIGTGNIGTDLLMKIRRSTVLECGIFAGRSMSPNVIRAQQMGIPITDESIEYITRYPDCCQIVFDATSAAVHRTNAPMLRELRKFTIDLTPARIGKMCVPVLNMEECLQANNVNLITCGGQATIPLAHTLVQVHPDAKYIEIVATIASKSAGPGTRSNIDEFTQTTREALSKFTGVSNTKAIIVLNPAEPPIAMRNTIYAIIDNPNMDEITRRVYEMEAKIRKYVPGYKITLGPVFENGRVTTSLEVVGLGDYLPKYSGNLDIITCAAIEVAETYAREKILGGRNA